jgi:hypothetical protein
MSHMNRNFFSPSRTPFYSPVVPVTLSSLCLRINVQIARELVVGTDLGPNEGVKLEAVLSAGVLTVCDLAPDDPHPRCRSCSSMCASG